MSERDFFTIVSRLSDPADPQPVPMAVVPAAGAGKFDELPQYFTEDSELRIHGFAPIEEFWQGCANMVEAVRANFARISHQNSSIEGLIQQGDAVALRVRETGELVADRVLTNGHSRTGHLGGVWRDVVHLFGRPYLALRGVLAHEVLRNALHSTMIILCGISWWNSGR